MVRFCFVFDVHVENFLNLDVRVLIHFINRIILMVMSVNNSRVPHASFDYNIYIYIYIYILFFGGGGESHTFALQVLPI